MFPSGVASSEVAQPRSGAPGASAPEDRAARDWAPPGDAGSPRWVGDEPSAVWWDDAPPPRWGPGPEHHPARSEPSGWSAVELDLGSADAGVLGDAELIDSIIGFDQVVAWATARQTRLVAEFARRRPGDDPTAVCSDQVSQISRWAPDELGLALGSSRLAASARLAQAVRLCTELSQVLDAQQRGLLTAGKVRAIYEATLYLSPADAAAVAARVLARAPGQSLAQLRASLTRAVIAVDPQGAAARHRAARRDRRVTVGPEQDGMASLWALLSAPDAASAFEWLTRLARGIGGDDPRGMDARRADLLVELLTGHLAITTPNPTTPNPTTTNPTTTDPTTDQDTPPTTTTHSTPDESSAGKSSTDNNPRGSTNSGTPNNGTPNSSTDTSGTRGAGPRRPGGTPSTGATSTGATPTGVAPTGTATPTQATRPAPLRRAVTPGKPLIQIVLSHSTLTGADDHPAELAGYGPIPADLARDIAADATWHRLLTDPLSGTLLDHGRTTYHPPAGLADHVRARDLTCRFPTCRRRATTAELDHTIPYPDGPTSEPNLYTGCQHHHHLKHHGGWTVTQHPDATIEWTTPTGHTYTSQPHDYRPEPPPPDPNPPPPPQPGPTDPDDDPPPF